VHQRARRLRDITWLRSLGGRNAYLHGHGRDDRLLDGDGFMMI
jgi:hypothetical protein